MTLAAAMLRANRESVATVAAREGYASEVAFRRAFAREVGTTPGMVQRAVGRA